MIAASRIESGQLSVDLPTLSTDDEIVDALGWRAHNPCGAMASTGLTSKTREVLDRTEQARAGLVESVKDLTSEQMGFRPSSDSWSIADVLHHLALAHEGTAKLMSVMLRRTSEESVPEDPDPEGSVLDSLHGVVPGVEEGKAVAPDLVMPKAYIAPDETLKRLRASRKHLVETVSALSPFDLTKLTFPHPFFGELDAYQWLLVTGWHERRHTKQIERIRQSPGFPAR